MKLRWMNENHTVLFVYDTEDGVDKSITKKHPQWEYYSSLNEIEEYVLPSIDERGLKIRIERNRKLAECDWTQVADAPVDKEAWAKYREELRDITKQSGFPDNVIWPLEP